MDEQRTVPTPDGGNGSAHATLYRADGSHRDVAPGELSPPDRQDDLLWIDIQADASEFTQDDYDRLEMPTDVLPHLSRLGSKPTLRRYGDFIVVHAVVVESTGDLKFKESMLGVAAGRNIVITLHHTPITFIDAIRKREHGENRLGHLNARSFVAALLDWQLDSYHDAVAQFECAVESLEEAVLDGRQGDCTRELVMMRRGASQLRRMLAPHRRIFSSLSRPDFQPEDEPHLIEQFQRLEDHFDRAMDAVENARELVIGSFGVFSNQVALRTNDSMRLLTFATVVIGCQAVMAGVLGMNFKAAMFDSPWGFWAAIGAMTVVTVLAIWWGRRKDWI